MTPVIPMSSKQSRDDATVGGNVFVSNRHGAVFSIPELTVEQEQALIKFALRVIANDRTTGGRQSSDADMLFAIERITAKQLN